MKNKAKKTVDKKWIVGLDLDGVIFDHTENKLKLAKQLGFRLSRRDTASDIISAKITPEAKVFIQKRTFNNPAFFPPLMAGAASGLAWLFKNNFRFFLISRRSNGKFAAALLKKKGLWPAYFRPSNVFFVETRADKNSKARELGINIYVDDQPSVLDELKSVKHKFLLDPLRAYVGPAKYRRVRSWRELISELKRLS